jgi:serine/threonine-protein kinase
MDSTETTPVPGTDGADAPFFSPDSQWLGFFADNKLKKVSVSGGVPITLCDSQGLWHSASWGSDDTIVFYRFNGVTAPGLLRLPAAGGAPKQATTPDSKTGEVTQLWPDLLPGAKAVLFAAGPAVGNLANTAQIVVSSLQPGERRDLIGGSSPRYARTGHLVYAQGATLMAVPFDPRRLALTGSPVPVLEGVLQSLWSGAAQYSFSSTGTLVYVPGGLQGAQRRLVWVDRKGTEQPLPAPVRGYRTPRISPDGQRVAVASSEAGDNIWLYDLARETLTRLTFEGTVNANPNWTPDGRRIGFVSNRTAGRNVFWQPADGRRGCGATDRIERLPAYSWFLVAGQSAGF